MNTMNRFPAPRNERANRLSLMLLWAEASAEFRHEFANDFAAFEHFAEQEAQRLIQSAWNQTQSTFQKRET